MLAKTHPIGLTNIPIKTLQTRAIANQPIGSFSQ
jgi:hypothetical protein